MKLPDGYKLEDQIIYGMRASHPGLMEMMIYNPKKRNAIGSPPEKKLGDLFIQADQDPNVKAILLHGGRYFSSGNDLSMFTKFGVSDKEEFIKIAEDAVMNILGRMIMAMAKCRKPIITVIRGGANGIGFTMCSHSTFCYVTPEAKLMTPFMKSA